MNRFVLAVASLVVILSSSGFAQNKPIMKSQIATFDEFQGAPARSIELMDYFADPDGSAAVRMDTVLGTMNILLYGDQKPITVANFLRYVNEGRYFTTDASTGQRASSFIHRSVAGFVIQGGGFIGTSDPADSTHTKVLATQVGALPPIQNEPGISNTRGTIAMAKVAEQRDSSGNIIPGTGANSATSQWFINLGDNSANLDGQNGGFTAFGRVAGNGMSVADAIAALPKVNAGSPFDSLPLRNYTSPNPIRIANLVSIPGITQIATLSFTATSSNTSVATVTVSGTHLLVSGVGLGNSTITVTATDLEGLTVSQSFTVNVVSAPGRLVEVSTRLQVGTNENVLIAGFIVRGGTSKRLMVRGIGPSSGVTGALANPSLELHDGTGALITSNDNWGDNSNKQEIVDTGIAPTSNLESAILATVPSNDSGLLYTAVLQGVDGTTGIGVVEAYDLDSGAGSTILNVSTRGRVGTDSDVMIAGFFGGGSESKRILVRGIGPSLSGFVNGALANPTIELHDANGGTIDVNDDWQSSPQASEIQASGIAPSNPKESAMLDLLAPGSYTAIIRGVNNTTGIGSVEVYQLP